MTRRHCARDALALIACSIVSLGASGAQRTFVATYGNDAHACSAASPCRQLAAALTKTDVGGEVVILDSGGFGPVNIGKSVTIASAPGAYAALTVFAGNGVNVNGANVEVTLRGLRITGQGGASGIFFQQGRELHVEDCTVSNMSDNGIDVRAPDSRTLISRTVLRSNSNSGVYADAYSGAVNVTVTRSEIATNGWGLYARQGARIRAVDTTIAGNVVGVFARIDNQDATFDTEVGIDAGAITANLLGVSLSNTASGVVRVSVSRAGLHDNALAASVQGSAYAELALSNSHSAYASIALNGQSAAVILAGNAFNQASINCTNGGNAFTYGNNAGSIIATGCTTGTLDLH